MKEANPIIRTGGDNIHVHANKGDDLARKSSRIFDNKIASAREIGDMVNKQGSSASGGAVR